MWLKETEFLLVQNWALFFPYELPLETLKCILLILAQMIC